MTKDAAPPPPPPLSPPPALDTTTIGKYIARFRYEKPQPRESRVSAQRGDFWWTKSPRYVRSPSPPSTWASGGAFSFPDDELDDELAVDSPKNEEEKESSAPEPIEEDDDESVDSVESKLRRRLGVWESDSSRGISGKTEEFSDEKVEDVMQSWGSADWSSVDLQGMDEELEGEDPEEVIERVRRRLGWAGTSGVNLETASRLKPLELRLSMDERADRKEASSRTAFKLKPPLSPGSFRREQTVDSGGGYKSESSWGSLDHDADERVDEVASSTSSAGATSVREQVSMMERAYEEKQPAVDESEEKLAAQTTSSVDGSDTSSKRGAIDCAMPASSSSVDLSRSQESELSRGSNHSLRGSATAIDDTLAEDHEEGGRFDSGAYASDRNEEVEEEEDTPKEQCEPQEDDTVYQVPELPLLQTSSPARPESVVERASSGSFPRRSHESNSSLHRSEGIIPRETTKTLDSLVSLVVHSWENDFFTDPEPLDVEQDDGQNPNAPDDSATNDSTSPQGSISVHSKDGNEVKDTRNSAQDVTTAVSVEREEPQAIAPKDICTQPAHDDTEKGDSSLPVVQRASQVSVPVDNVETQSDHEEEEKEDSPVPGEEEDQIVRMLLERIALLEEALRQIDS